MNENMFHLLFCLVLLPGRSRTGWKRKGKPIRTERVHAVMTSENAEQIGHARMASFFFLKNIRTKEQKSF